MTIQTQIPALPSQVKVGAVTYPVELVADLTAVAMSEGEDLEFDHLAGRVNYAAPYIQINADDSPVFRLKSFLHEFVHAVLHENGEDINADESFVERTANQLAQVFVDNGWTFGVSETRQEEAQEYEVVAQGEVPTPIRGVSADIYVHEGVEYRKVSRKAQVGELVLVVSNEMCHAIDVGEVVEIESVEGGAQAGGGYYLEGDDGSDRDYLVLEPPAKGGADHATS